jgi:mono/diheme cytochrome c family protein
MWEIYPKDRPILSKVWSKIGMKWSAFVLIALLALLLSACGLTLAADVTPPPDYQEAPEPEVVSESTGNLTSPDLINGQGLFLEKCEPCHGPVGRGGGSLEDRLTNPAPEIGSVDLARKSVPAEWFRVITEGRLEKQMPPFASLTEQQRWDVLAYVYTLSSSAERLEMGKEIYSLHCADCHGADGDGGPKAGSTDFTSLEWNSGQSLDNISQVITTGKAPSMPAFESQLSEDEIWMVSEFIRSLPNTTSEGMATSEDSVQADNPDSQLTSAEEISSTQVLSDTTAMNPAVKTGFVSGVVTNASGGEAPAGLEILLHGFDGMQIAITRTAQLGEDGSFLFDDVQFIPDRAFVSTVEFDGLTYGSNIVAVEGNEEFIQLPIEIFESTTDPSELVIERMHLFLEPVEENVLRVIELLIVSNLGMKTVRPESETQPSLVFSLPEGAANLEFQDGELGGRFTQTADGFGDLSAVRPGMNVHQILVSFEIPVDKKAVITQPVRQSANAVVVLVPDAGLKVKSEQLQDGGTRDVEGLTYRMYNGGELDAGEQLEMVVTKQSPDPFPTISSSSNLGIGIGLGVLAATLILAGVWMYQHNKNQPGVSEVEQPISKPYDTKESIMDAILALDDLYKEGQISEEPYRKRREELKDRLRELMNSSETQS